MSSLVKSPSPSATFIVVADGSAEFGSVLTAVAHAAGKMNPARILLVSTDVTLALDVIDALDRLDLPHREIWKARGGVLVADDLAEAACMVAATAPAVIALRLDDPLGFTREMLSNLHPAVSGLCSLEHAAEMTHADVGSR